jgi:hypothetical protein
VFDKEDALRRVCELLAEKAPPDEPWVVIDEQTREIESAWIFFYNSKRFVETGNIIYHLAGNGPVFVNKKTGDVQFYGALPPLKAIIEDYEKKI